MSVQRKDTEVRIGRRTLWIGAQAYPLHLITSVQSLEIVPDGAPHLHLLNIAMAGESYAALVSEDKELIHELTERLVRAIADPAAEYVIHVNHIDVSGDPTILSEMTGTTATPTKARPAARSSGRANLGAPDRAADRAAESGAERGPPCGSRRAGAATRVAPLAG